MTLADPTIIAAFIAGGGVVFSAFVSVVVAQISARDAVRSEQTKRQRELALKISDIVSSKDEDVRRAAMRRFAVAVVKVIQPKNNEVYGMVYFIPMNSRVTVGRDKDNDIVLDHQDRYLSRWHCGFLSDQRNVWIEDYKSTNGTGIKGLKIDRPRQLESGDEIELGPFVLSFQAIHENTILSQ